MKNFSSPRGKLVLAGSLLAALILGIVVSKFGLLWGSRAILVGVAAALLVILAMKREQRTSIPALPRLKVNERIQLSPKCQLVLVEVDGRPSVLVFGDGFASFHSPDNEGLARKGGEP